MVAGTEESVLGHSATEGQTGKAKTVDTDLRDHKPQGQNVPVAWRQLESPGEKVRKPRGLWNG